MSSFHNGAQWVLILGLELLVPTRSCFQLRILCWVIFFHFLCKSGSSWNAFDTFCGIYVSTEL